MSARSSAKPICQACNRPFDPRSAGATLLLGPTCAKRVGRGPDFDESQLAFSLPVAPERNASARPAPVTLRAPTRQIPARFKTRYDMAKMAFEELFREFCLTSVLLTGERAVLAEQELWERGPKAYALSDPNLPWLEPEHDLTLLIDDSEGKAYHRRVFNDVVTLLEIDPARSVKARHHIQTICDYVRDLTALCEEQEAVQLSLL